MLNMGLNCSFITKENVLIVRLDGELDHHEANILREEWQKHLQGGYIEHIIINAENLTFMDSSGIGVILGRYKEIVRLGGQMVVCSIQEPIKKIFTMSGLFKIIQLEPTEKHALLSLGVAS